MRTPIRWLVVAIITVSTLASPEIGTAARPRGSSSPGCSRLYRLKEGTRYARRIWAGTHHATRWQRHHAWHMVLCQRNDHARKQLRRVIRREKKANAHRIRVANSHPWHSSVVSWYYDDGSQTASGRHYAYGVADCGSDKVCYPFGTRIEFCDHGCVVAIVDDHGPYVAGRDFDLDEAAAHAIGFGGVGSVRWRIH